MESTKTIDVNIIHDLSPLIRVHKNGQIERLVDPARIPPGSDPNTGVESKDIILFPERGVSVRLFKPKPTDPDPDPNPEKKVPVMVYFHGGGFCIESTFSPLYHNYLNSLAYSARTLIVSVEYRLAPEHPLPAAYDDCWDALDWVLSHGIPHKLFDSRSKMEPWIQDYGDLSRVVLGGDSAGANITHHMALRMGTQGFPIGSIGHISGIILFHPYFWSKDRIGDEAVKLTHQQNPSMMEKLWPVICPDRSEPDDPWINPVRDPSLSQLGCERVLIVVSEKDVVRDRGLLYKEVLEKSGWQGKAKIVEYKGEDHVFHLFNPLCANAADLMAKVVQFINPAASNSKA